jgi:hypothetical protein
MLKTPFFSFISIYFSTVLFFSHFSVAEIQRYSSPSGVVENCEYNLRLSAESYSLKDLETEKQLCSLNMYNPSLKLCGKNWSTSPSTIILNSEQTVFSDLAACNSKKTMNLYSKLAKYKTSMNEEGTSGTFSNSSIMYYHFSRYLQTSVTVPVAVYRTMDSEQHFQRVSSKVTNFENSMIQTAWQYMQKAAVNPQSIRPVEELFTDGNRQIFGALIEVKGNEKYGEYLRGKKTQQWGIPQYQNMVQTPIYQALNFNADILSSVELLSSVAQNQYAVEFGSVIPSRHQAIMWMQEIFDMTILDYILQQQDRPGNIHFQWRLFYLNNGKLDSKRVKIQKQSKSEGIESKYASYVHLGAAEYVASQMPEYKQYCQGQPCFVVQKTILEDNDAGGREYYNAFYRDLGFLQSLRHASYKTYLKLNQLAVDVKSQGPAYIAMKKNFRLNVTQLEQLKKNIIEATATLNTLCRKGLLRFDLDYENYMRTGQLTNSSKSCK